MDPGQKTTFWVVLRKTCYENSKVYEGCKLGVGGLGGRVGRLFAAGGGTGAWWQGR